MTETAEPLASSPAPSPRMIRNRWIIFGLVALTLIVYWPVGRFDFINYDDPKYITENPEVVDGLTWDSFKQSFRSTQGGYRHPLTWWSHLLDVSLFGLNNPGGHHNTSLLVHTINVVLLWWVLMRLTGAAWPSAWVAAILAVHPTHLESVAWISERKDTLSLLCMLLTIWAYQRYTEKPQVGRYLLVVLAMAGALMAKPMMVTLPAVLLLLDVWPLRRIPAGRGFWRSLGRPIVEKLPLLVMSVVSGLITIRDTQSVDSFYTLESVPLGQRLATSIVSYGRYLAKLVWPTDLAIFYPFPPDGWPTSWIIGSAALVAALTALVLWQATRRPYLLIGWLWFVGTMLPVIGLVVTGDASMADRYTYVPYIGLCIAIAWLARDLAVRLNLRRLLLPLGAATALACAALSVRGVWHWQNSLTVMGHALAVTDHNWTAHTNYGSELLKAGRADEAEHHLRAALADRPASLLVNLNLANYLIDHGSPDEARRILQPILLAHPNDAKTLAISGRLMARMGQHARAIALFDRALANDPRRSEALIGKAASLLTLNRVDEAEPYLQQALAIRPDSLAYHRLGLIAAARNDGTAALENFQRAIELANRPSQPRYDLGILLWRMRRYDEALKELQTALDLYYPRQLAEKGQTQLQMGFLLQRMGRTADAAQQHAAGLEQLRRAVAEAPDDAVAHYQLAMGLLQLQDPAATQAVQEAMDTATRVGNLLVIEQLKGRLAALSTTRPATAPSTAPSTTRAIGR